MSRRPLFGNRDPTFAMATLTGRLPIIDHGVARRKREFAIKKKLEAAATALNGGGGGGGGGGSKGQGTKLKLMKTKPQPKNEDEDEEDEDEKKDNQKEENKKNEDWKTEQKRSFEIIDSSKFVSAEQRNQANNTVEINWTDAQKRVFDIVRSRRNVFFTGKPGTGKTTTVNAAKRIIENELKLTNVVYLAITGAACSLIDGETLQSFYGLSVSMMNNSPDVIARAILERPKLKKKWQELQLILVDECSMFSKKDMERMDAVAKIVRGSREPNGGILSFMTGDFRQLGPIGKKAKKEEEEAEEEENDDVAYCFESPIFTQWFPPSQQIVLTQCFRQTENHYINVLNDILNGELTPESDQLMCDKTIETNRQRQAGSHKNVPVLTTHRYQAKQINDREYSQLSPETTHYYEAIFECHKRNFYEEHQRQMRKFGKNASQYASKTGGKVAYQPKESDKVKHALIQQIELKRECNLDTDILEKGKGLYLRLGERVRLRNNLSHKYGLVTGRLGQVIGFEESGIDSRYMNDSQSLLQSKPPSNGKRKIMSSSENDNQKENESNDEKAGPIKLQGTTPFVFKPNLSNHDQQASFQFSSLPLTASSSSSFSSLAVPSSLPPIVPALAVPSSLPPIVPALAVPSSSSPIVPALAVPSSSPPIVPALAVPSSSPPIVRFDNGIVAIIRYRIWYNQSRHQTVVMKMIPLSPGWAFSIHSAQGMQFQRVDVMLAKVFTEGQFFVAMSRAMSWEGLGIISWNANCLKPKLKVLEFYKQLESRN